MMDLQRGCLTSNEDQHLTISCDLHVLSTKGEYSLHRIHRLLEEEFPDVVGLQPFDHPPPAAQVYHSMDIADTAPIHCKVRLLSDEKLTAAKAAFAEMEAAGVIRRSSSP